MILYNHHKAVMAWASEKLGYEVGGPGRVALGMVVDGELVGAVIFHDFSWPDIKIIVVSSHPKFFTRAHAREVLRYPFVQLKCKRITALAEATNQRSRAFLCRFGFRQEGVHPNAYPNGDAVSYGLLLKDAARWLAEEVHGEKLSAECA